MPKIDSSAGEDEPSATPRQIELYVRAMEGRGLAATTIDRRLATVCGFYRFAHIDGRIASNPAQYVRRPKVHANDARGLDPSEAVQLRVVAPDPVHALGSACSAWSEAVDELGAPTWKIVRAEVLTREEFEQECQLEGVGGDGVDGRWHERSTVARLAE